MNKKINNKLTGDPKPIKARQSRGKLSREHFYKNTQKAIYKIINNVNDKIYIGQSNDPNRRFEEHCKYDRDNTLIHKAIRKYGREHFKMEIIEWTKNYNEREKYWIKKLNSLSPNGYNMVEDANPPLLAGENNSSAIINKEISKEVIKDLKYTFLDVGDICKKYNISVDIIRHINDGTSWRQQNIKYPIRKQLSNNELKVEIVKVLLKETALSQELIANLVGMKRSFVTMINNGKNHNDKNEDYPLRKD